MPSFSQKSLGKLDTCDIKLQRLFKEVIKITDCTIIEGHRTRERQAILFNDGKSKVRTGKHNESPSQAVDVALWPILKIGINGPLITSQA